MKIDHLFNRETDCYIIVGKISGNYKSISTITLISCNKIKLYTDNRA